MTHPTTYPTRERFFSHRFTRLLFRSCAGATIGPDATLLLIAIAHCEDARRYSGPVAFFASNLADQIGLSISSMERARRRAVAAGWLNYIPGAKRRAATYFVTIPDREAEKPDGPLDEDAGAVLRQPDGASGEHVTEQAVSIRGACDGASGEHVTDLLPSPFPSPKEEGANRNGSLPALNGEKSKKPKKTAKAKADATTVPIPPKLDAPAFREVWAAWLAHRKNLRKPMTAFAAELQFRKLLKLDPANAVACVEKSIAAGWSDVFEEKFLPGGSDHRRSTSANRHPGYDEHPGETKPVTVAQPMAFPANANGKAVRP